MAWFERGFRNVSKLWTALSRRLHDGGHFSIAPAINTIRRERLLRAYCAVDRGRSVSFHVPPCSARTSSLPSFGK